MYKNKGTITESGSIVFRYEDDKTDFVSVKDNDAVIVNNQTETIKKYMASLNDAWYETAKYLLLNNKKAISQELNY